MGSRRASPAPPSPAQRPSPAPEIQAEIQAEMAVLDALREMFPHMDRDALSDVLAGCGGDAEAAVAQLLVT